MEKYLVKEVNPLKQGLKLFLSFTRRINSSRVKEVNPLKQGLKHTGSSWVGVTEVSLKKWIH